MIKSNLITISKTWGRTTNYTFLYQKCWYFFDSIKIFRTYWTTQHKDLILRLNIMAFVLLLIRENQIENKLKNNLFLWLWSLCYTRFLHCMLRIVGILTLWIIYLKFLLYAWSKLKFNFHRRKFIWQVPRLNLLYGITSYMTFAWKAQTFFIYIIIAIVKFPIQFYNLSSNTDNYAQQWKYTYNSSFFEFISYTTILHNRKIT